MVLTLHIIIMMKRGRLPAHGAMLRIELADKRKANIFGPPQQRDLHEVLAREHFAALFVGQKFAGQLRTRLGISGYETKGPQSAAAAQLNHLGLAT